MAKRKLSSFDMKKNPYELVHELGVYLQQTGSLGFAKKMRENFGKMGKAIDFANIAIDVPELQDVLFEVFYGRQYGQLSKMESENESQAFGQFLYTAVLRLLDDTKPLSEKEEQSLVTFVRAMREVEQYQLSALTNVQDALATQSTYTLSENLRVLLLFVRHRRVPAAYEEEIYRVLWEVYEQGLAKERDLAMLLVELAFLDPSQWESLVSTAWERTPREFTPLLMIKIVGEVARYLKNRENWQKSELYDYLVGQAQALQLRGWNFKADIQYVLNILFPDQP